MAKPSLQLIEFPADDPQRALAFWSGLLEEDVRPRTGREGSGWQTDPATDQAAAFGVHERGRGPGDTNALPYVSVDDLHAAVERVRALGGSVVHPGERWAICRDSEGSPFALAARATAPAAPPA